jgi:hypothetical protein
MDKLAQILSYLYMSNCPYLFINTKNVLLNSKLLTDKYQHLKIIYSDYNSYINNDLIKLIKIGNFLKYNKKFQYYQNYHQIIIKYLYHHMEKCIFNK